MSGITIEGLTPSSIVSLPSDMEDELREEIRTYNIGGLFVHLYIAHRKPYPWVEFVREDQTPIHAGGYIGWSSHPDGDRLGSPYWALSSMIYALACMHMAAGGKVRVDEPCEDGEYVIRCPGCAAYACNGWKQALELRKEAIDMGLEKVKIYKDDEDVTKVLLNRRNKYGRSRNNK
jgi:hypothetical protein